MRVYVTPRGKTYHFSYREMNRGLKLDDDCPVAANIIRGYTAYIEMDEEEAIRRGYRPCGHCLREYHEDKAEGCAAVMVGIILIPITMIAGIISMIV